MNITKHRFFRRFIAVAITSSVVVACGDVVNDPTFREWCGDSLCAWKLEEGSIKRAPTWTDSDYGVAFVETPTTISQSVDKSPKCLQFDTIADLDPSAQMVVEIDFDRDGTIDTTQTIAAAHWSPETTLVTAPPTYDGFILYIKKQGTGNAVLAQLRVQDADDKCGAAPPVELMKLPIGDPCGSLGQGNDSLCETGVCCNGFCAECCSDAQCGGKSDAGASGADASADAGAGSPGKICRARAVSNAGDFFGATILPAQCDPGGGTHPSGAPCLSNDDCTSGTCQGAHIFASTSTDADAGACDSESLTLLGSCVVTAVAGGHCR